MSYNRSQIEVIIRRSCRILMNRQPMLFVKKNNINERTVSEALASEIRNFIKFYHVNSEFNKMTDENGTLIPKRINLDPHSKTRSLAYPDIIIHRQEDKEHNLLILELKMAWKNDLMKNDLDKLNRYMIELEYKYGLYLELGESGIEEMIWFN